jgi:hypothetical protein
VCPHCAACCLLRRPQLGCVLGDDDFLHDPSHAHPGTETRVSSSAAAAVPMRAAARREHPPCPLPRPADPMTTHHTPRVTPHASLFVSLFQAIIEVPKLAEIPVLGDIVTAPVIRQLLEAIVPGASHE